MLPPELGRLRRAPIFSDPRSGTARKRPGIGDHGQRCWLVGVNPAELFFQGKPLAGGQGAAPLRAFSTGKHDDFLPSWRFLGGRAQCQEARYCALLTGSEKAGPRDEDV